MGDYYASPQPLVTPAAPAPLHAGLTPRRILLIAAGLALAYWAYTRYKAGATQEGFADGPAARTRAEGQSCSGSALLGNYLTCDKFANDFQGRQKSPIERYQDQLTKQREKERASPLVPDVKLPPVQDYVLPKSTSHGNWDKVRDIRGEVAVSQGGLTPLTQVSPAAVDAAMAAQRLKPT